MADWIRSTRALCAAAVVCAACKQAPSEHLETQELVWQKVQSDTVLEDGRAVWLANCKRCHAHGIEGAPRIGNAAEWTKRRSKDLGALVRSVIEGVQGKAGGEMPPRAGNEKLTDPEIEAAVRFMVAVSQ